MKKIFKTTVYALFSLLLFTACTSETSLQQYIVDKQNDTNFITIDLPSSLLLAEENTLNAAQLETVKSVKKVNVVALESTENNQVEYEAEKQKVAAILSDSKYETLMKFGSKNQGASLLISGDVEAIDEIIIFASDEKKGFGLFRVIGEQMNPTQIAQLMNQVNDKNFDLSFMNEIGGLLN